VWLLQGKERVSDGYSKIIDDIDATITDHRGVYGAFLLSDF
jgi:hypothetical protein